MPPNNPVTAARTLDMLRSAMGPVMTAALDDPDIIEIMVNPDGALWFDRLGEGCSKSETVVTPQAAERIIRLVGSHINEDVTASNPIVSAELPNHEGGGGERFEGVLQPVAAAPSFAIRKKAVAVFTLGDYVESGIITPDQSVALGEAVTDRKNILIVGGTSSGKTTLANALLFEVAQCNDRVVILEDTRELQCEADDVVALRTHGLNVTLSHLVRSTLRLRPDRVIVGEVRGPEALDMLKVWNTGHPGGIATVHANSAEAGLLRIEQLTLEAATNAPKALIAEAIDIVVFIAGRGAKRRVKTVAMLTKLSRDGYELMPLKPKSPPTLTLVKET